MAKPPFSQLMADTTRKMADTVAMYGDTGDVREAFIAEFIAVAMRWYSKEEVSQWLISVGMAPKKGSSGTPRIGSKKRMHNPDGTYTLDGVTFGEPKREALVDFAVEQAIRKKDK